ncbi:MAG: Gfo/Idh/MocA family oxidoreductase [Candidatus Hydrogenedentes bacterium]|nr:Gfo/Idh/MocA family oxidoreductase [Candidatus Hydrogenedentota bacterium]
METTGNDGISRRHFLYGMGASLAAPAILPSAAFGADGAAAPNERIQIALIGAGGQGKGLTENAIKHKRVRIVAVCDVDKARLAEAKRLVDEYYGDQNCASHGDYREVLARDDVDAVIVATPDHWHAIICVEAAKRGKDIYCEKPLTWSLGEGRAVVKAVKENNRIFQVGSMQRSGRQFKQACEFVRNGYLGHISHILVSLPNYGNAIWVDEFPKPPEELDWEFYVGPATWTPFHPKRYHWDWRWWMSFGGGQMMDWIGHHGDIAHMAMDWDNTGPIEVEGVRWDPVTERNNLYDAPAQYHFECKYANGTTMTVANASNMPDVFKSNATGELGTMFFGDGGQWLYVDRSGIKASDDKLTKTRFKQSDFRFRREGNHMTDFIECVASREECIAPVNAGHRSASIGHLGKIACMLGAKFQWNPETETVVDNPALNGMLTRKYRGDWRLEA